MTPGSLLAVQIWNACDRSGLSSSDPPLTLRTSGSALLRWNSLVPQSGQKLQAIRPPESVGRSQTLGAPDVSPKSSTLTISEMPKAEADCARHSVQWQA